MEPQTNETHVEEEEYIDSSDHMEEYDSEDYIGLEDELNDFDGWDNAGGGELHNRPEDQRTCRVLEQKTYSSIFIDFLFSVQTSPKSITACDNSSSLAHQQALL